MGTEMNSRLLLMKEELDSVGTKLNGLTWQRIDRHMQEYATECVKASLEKASINIVMKLKDNHFELDMCDEWTEVDKSSITSPDNIVLL